MNLDEEILKYKQTHKPNKEEQLLLFIYGGCVSCDNEGYFSYNGCQEGFKDIPDILQYNCQSCYTTISKNSISEKLINE